MQNKDDLKTIEDHGKTESTENTQHQEHEEGKEEQQQQEEPEREGREKVGSAMDKEQQERRGIWTLLRVIREVHFRCNPGLLWGHGRNDLGPHSGNQFGASQKFMPSDRALLLVHTATLSDNRDATKHWLGW